MPPARKKTSKSAAAKKGADAAKRGGKTSAAPRRKISQYRHQGQDAKRVNNPPAGIANLGELPEPDLTHYPVPNLDPHLHPQLLWARKGERAQFAVPLRPIHIHERVDPRAIVRAVQRQNGNGQPLLFELPDENPPLERAVEFYRHPRNWANRLVAGDSRIVMNSLLQKESMAGKVQCAYMDPPYGIKYGSNFQPFVNKREVKDQADGDLTAEPEMIRAFRDTWELGVHSYLNYLRERLVLCRELLADSGSCFVQISDENVHLVRSLMDETFGMKNFIALITVKKTSAPTDYFLPVVSDFILWYAKDKGAAKAKHRSLYLERNPGEEGASQYQWAELPDGTERKLNRSEFLDHSLLPKGSRVFATSDMTSSHEYSQGKKPYTFRGRQFYPGERFWSTSPEGMKRIEDENRMIPVGNTLFYKRYWNDFPVYPLSSTWSDTSSSFGKRIYVVQTTIKTVQRCMLMTTDPGDLVFDPTCGSGTTAYVAEQWGRRWITCDTSRVALTLARQRLMTASFPYYKLQDEKAGVAGGFVCKEVPHVTLKSVANGLEPETETLCDRPESDRKRARVSGPFTVEALPAPVVTSPEEIAAGLSPGPGTADGPEVGDDAARGRETARHMVWRDELSENGVRLKNGRVLEFSRVETFSQGEFLHLEVETKGAGGAGPERGFVSFGPEHAPMSGLQAERALQEAGRQGPRPTLLVFAAFEFDPEAARTLDEFQWRGGEVVRAKMDPDLHVQDLKRQKRQKGDAAFWLMGRPDAELRRAEDGAGSAGSDAWVAEVRGFDYYNPRREAGKRLETGGPERIAMWMLDPDYDGRLLYPRQVFFPMSGKNEGWGRLSRDLRSELDPERMERYRGTVSLPFELGAHRRAAVKIVDDMGIESLRVLEAPEE